MPRPNALDSHLVHKGKRSSWPRSRSSRFRLGARCFDQTPDCLANNDWTKCAALVYKSADIGKLSNFLHCDVLNCVFALPFQNGKVGFSTYRVELATAAQTLPRSTETRTFELHLDSSEAVEGIWRF